MADRSWYNNGAIITVPHMNKMPLIVNQIAVEHLELALDRAEEWASKSRTRGAIFLADIPQKL